MVDSGNEENIRRYQATCEDLHKCTKESVKEVFIMPRVSRFLHNRNRRLCLIRFGANGGRSTNEFIASSPSPRMAVDVDCRW